MPTPFSVPRAVTFDCWNTLIGSRGESFKQARLARWSEIFAGRLTPAQVYSQFMLFDRTVKRFRERDPACDVREAVDAGLAALTIQPTKAATGALAHAYVFAIDELTVTPASSAIDLLTALRERDVRTGIVSNVLVTPSARMRSILGRFGLSPMIGALAFSDEVGSLKPDEAIFRHCLSELDVAGGQRVVHIGDSHADIVGALRLGLVAVRTVEFHDDGVPEVAPSATVRRLADVGPLLGLPP